MVTRKKYSKIFKRY